MRWRTKAASLWVCLVWGGTVLADGPPQQAHRAVRGAEASRVDKWTLSPESEQPERLAATSADLAQTRSLLATAATAAPAPAAPAPATVAPRIERSADGMTVRVWPGNNPDTPTVGKLGPFDPPPEPCPDGALFSQRVSTFDDGSVAVATSDVEFDYVRYERFWDVRGVITGLSWYGVFVDDFGFGCDANLQHDFTVTFYEDDGGLPGAEVGSQTATIIGEPSNMEVGMGGFATRFTLTLDQPVTLQDGWVSIKAVDLPDFCPFGWLGSPIGDHTCCVMSGGELTCLDPNDEWSFDLSLCLLGTFYPGACCDDLTGLCSDGAEYVDCLPPMRFTPDRLCSELEPLCGQTTGACCEDWACTIRTPGDCLAVGGEYKGDDTPCDPSPCPPQNDHWADALPISEETVLFDTTLATLDGPQSCGINQNVWYCYTPQATGTVTIMALSQDEREWEWFDPAAGVYEGCGTEPLGPAVACDPVNRWLLWFDVQAGTEYLIEVGDSGIGTVAGAAGSLTIYLDEWEYGACCSETAPYCYEAFEPECEGAFAGDGTTCDPVDCNSSGFPDACDIALEMSEDCNGNGIPDECDISTGGSDDYDLDGVPDECDLDCNSNGIPDQCDVDCGIGNCHLLAPNCGGSADCQGDGVPDDCQVGEPVGAERILWDNGLPLVPDMWYELPVSQVGGAKADIITVDDFVLTEDTRINTFHALLEHDPWFVPTGRVRIEVWPGDGMYSPIDYEGPVAVQWVPTDGGSVTSTPVEFGIAGERFRYDVTGLDIPLSAGTWWIGMAVEGVGDMGSVTWSVSHDGWNVVTGDANFHDVEEPMMYFIPWSWLGNMVDVSFTVGTTALGVDCNDNGVPDECDISNCGGELWCSDCNTNGVPDVCEPDCNSNGIPDDCDLRDCDGSPWCSDCNGNVLPDQCDVPPLGTSQDCQPNGIPDECEDDCNANDMPDDCDLRDCDGSIWCGDCNTNSIIDECDAGYPGGVTYQFDDGTAETSLGVWDADVDVAWIQGFTVQPGSETIVAVATCFGNPYQAPSDTGVSAGDPFRVFVWDDPDNDGLWYDAVLLASADGVIDAASVRTDVLQEVAIGPVTVSGSFFIGAAVQVSEAFPAPLSYDDPAHRSWASFEYVAYGGFNPNAFYADNVDDIGYSGNWLLRAVSAVTAAPNDCNENGIPDDCELCGDLNGDAEVDYDDYVIFLDAFGGEADGDPAEDWCCDYDDSGAVGMGDYAAWLECYRDYIGDPTAGPPEKPWWDKRPGVEPVGGGQGIQKVPSVRP